jgi:hypothetical protein
VSDGLLHCLVALSVGSLLRKLRMWSIAALLLVQDDCPSDD